MHRTLFCSALCIALAVTGCSTQPNHAPTNGNWQERSAQLASLGVWNAQGKIALRDGEKSESAALSWTQRNDQTELNLNGPLGLGATKIFSDGKTLEINTSGTASSYDISSPALIAKETGWDLPLQALQHWLKGIPAPEGDIKTLEIENGLLRKLEQSGWVITYQNYAQFGLYTLPTKLQLERSDNRAKLIVRNWQTEAV